MTRPARVLLVRHAPTTATRRHTFPVDEPLDERGRAQAAGLAADLEADRSVCSPALRCRETAGAAGLAAATIDPRWSELDFGRWAGRTFDEVWSEDEPGLRAWLDDPTRAPTGGGSLAALQDRVTAALNDLRLAGTTTAVVTSGGPIKVAVLAALGAPLTKLWNLDIAPCSVTTLHARPDGGWTVRAVNGSAPAAVPA